jgi:hypothetical protein
MFFVRPVCVLCVSKNHFSKKIIFKYSNFLFIFSRSFFSFLFRSPRVSPPRTTIWLFYYASFFSHFTFHFSLVVICHTKKEGSEYGLEHTARGHSIDEMSDVRVWGGKELNARRRHTREKISFTNYFNNLLFEKLSMFFFCCLYVYVCSCSVPHSRSFRIFMCRLSFIFIKTLPFLFRPSHHHHAMLLFVFRA